MNTSVLPYRRRVLRTSILIAAVAISEASLVWAGEQRMVVRDHIEQEWKNELLTYSFCAPKGACHPDSVTLDGPRGAVPVQLSQIEQWPGTDWVKSAKLSFIANLAPLAIDDYTVRYGPNLFDQQEPADHACPFLPSQSGGSPRSAILCRVGDRAHMGNAQETIDGQILIDVWPVNPVAGGRYLEVRALYRRGFRNTPRMLGKVNFV